MGKAITQSTRVIFLEFVSKVNLEIRRRPCIVPTKWSCWWYLYWNGSQCSNRNYCPKIALTQGSTCLPMQDVLARGFASGIAHVPQWCSTKHQYSLKIVFAVNLSRVPSPGLSSHRNRFLPLKRRVSGSIVAQLRLAMVRSEIWRILDVRQKVDVASCWSECEGFVIDNYLLKPAYRWWYQA